MSRCLFVVAVTMMTGILACADDVPTIEYEILGTFPHDPEAYTQGLLLHDGVLLESTGRYGESDVRRVDPASGEVIDIVRLDPELFGEGLARVGEELIQLTWKAGRALTWSIDLEPLGEFEYEGEGWGLCYDGESLWMSNGTSELVRRDPETFHALDTLQVTRGGARVRRLNELECVGDFIYSNVYQTDRIVRIEKTSGRVLGELDLARIPLSEPSRSGDPQAVLNGIAYVEETGVFLVTGKLWPSMIAIRLTE